MNGALLSNGNWTPVLDCMVSGFGKETALVFGAVWRYAQMREGVCRASLGTLARKSGCSTRHVRYVLLGLCELGYLEKVSVGPGRPNVYAVADTLPERLNWLELAAKRAKRECIISK